MRYRAVVFALCVFALSACDLGAYAPRRRARPTPSPTPTPTPTPPAQPKLLFSQEFDSYTSAIVPGTNVLTSWPLGSGVNSNATEGEVQIYVDVQHGESQLYGGVNPFSVSGGILTITARPTAGLPGGRTYTSGLLSTAGTFSFKQGYVEARMSLPGGSGFWPTLWMMQDPASSGGDLVWPPEVDIVQCSSRIADETYDAVFTGTSAGGVREQGSFVAIKGANSGFHVYGFEWTATTLNWWYDGAIVKSLAKPTGMDVPMFLMLSLACGDNGDWIGKPDGSTQSVSIDYLRVYDRRP